MCELCVTKKKKNKNTKKRLRRRSIVQPEVIPSQFIPVTVRLSDGHSYFDGHTQSISEERLVCVKKPTSEIQLPVKEPGKWMPCRISTTQQATKMEQLERMLTQGGVQAFVSTWSSLAAIAIEKDDSLQVLVDYRIVSHASPFDPGC